MRHSDSHFNSGVSSIDEDKPRPIVSILIVNFNYGKYIAEAIESALDQTYRNIEIIVVDDGSTDDSREVITRYGSRVISIFQENGGGAAAYNAAFQRASGEILCLLDSDDKFLPEKVERVVSVLCRTPAEWFFHRVERSFDQIGGGLGAGFQDVREQVVLRGRLPFLRTTTSGLSLTRALASKLFPLPASRFPSVKAFPDMILKAGCLSMAKGFFSDEKLSWMRLHEANNYSRQRSLFHDWRMRGEYGVCAAEELRKMLPCTRRFANRLATSHMVPFVLCSPYRRAALEYFRDSSWRERFYIAFRSVLSLGKWIPDAIRSLVGC